MGEPGEDSRGELKGLVRIAGVKLKRPEKSGNSTHRLHGRASGRVGLYEQLRWCLSKTSDLSFNGLKGAQKSLRVRKVTSRRTTATPNVTLYLLLVSCRKINPLFPQGT